MFIVKTKKEIKEFNLHEADDMTALSELMSNPSVNIIDKKYEEMTNTDIEGDSITKTTELHVYVEVEQCLL